MKFLEATRLAPAPQHEWNARPVHSAAEDDWRSFRCSRGLDNDVHTFVHNICICMYVIAIYVYTYIHIYI